MDHPVYNIFPKLWDRAQSDFGRRGRLVFAYVPKVKSRESITAGGRKEIKKKKHKPESGENNRFRSSQSYIIHNMYTFALVGVRGGVRGTFG